MCKCVYSWFPTEEYYLSLVDTLRTANTPYSLSDMICVLGHPTKYNMTHPFYNVYYWDNIILYTEELGQFNREYVIDAKINH